MSKLAFIDIEATGPDAQRADIIEIAFIALNEEGDEVDHFQSLVKPPRPIPDEIAQLTGITNQMIQNAPEFHAIAPRIFEKLEGARLVAHKAEFDFEILRRNFQQLGINLQNKYHCTLELARRVAPGMRSYSLAGLCEFFGISLKRNHRAMEDAEAAAALYRVLSLLDGQTAKLPTFLPRHQKLINKTRQVPGVMTFYDGGGREILCLPVDNLRSALEQALELSFKNRPIIARCREIKLQETGSLARAMLIASDRSAPLKWTLYAYKNKNGLLIARHGKAHPRKRALLYFARKEEALRALRKFNSRIQSRSNFAYQEGPALDKSEIVKRNSEFKRQLRLFKPDLENTLIRGKQKVDGQYQYVFVGENDQFALFESERELSASEDLALVSLRMRRLSPSDKRALQMATQVARNQSFKTDVALKVKRNLHRPAKPLYENRCP